MRKRKENCSGAERVKAGHRWIKISGGKFDMMAQRAGFPHPPQMCGWRNWSSFCTAR